MLYDLYCFQNRTYEQLSRDQKLSIKTIQKQLDNAVFHRKCISPCKWYIIMDTSYIKSIWWVMLFRLRDPITCTWKNLLWYYVEYETNFYYRKWIKELQDAWVQILWIVVDGRRWLLWGFDNIPTQMCHFHQKAIIRRMIWKYPIIQAHCELKDLMRWLWRISKETWTTRLYDLKRRYSKRLKEKNKQWRYMHTKARACFRSLEYHLPYLFVYIDYNWIPNSTNSWEWLFGRVKTKHALHRWLSPERTKKFIDWYLDWT